MKKLFGKTIFKILLSALAIAAGGFLLLNLTFLIDAVFQMLLRAVIGFLVSDIKDTMSPSHGGFLILVLVFSWFIFRSKIKPLIKAIYLTVPTGVVLATTGIYLYRWPIASYLVGGLFCLTAIYFFYKTRQPWIYYFSVILVALALAIFTMTGGEI